MPQGVAKRKKKFKIEEYLRQKLEATEQEKKLKSKYICFYMFVSHSVVSDSLRPPWTVACQAPLPWDFPGKNTGMGCHFLLQGIFLTQGSNPSLLHYRQILY